MPGSVAPELMRRAEEEYGEAVDALREATARLAALESAEKENGELLTALAECRDAFPVPAAGGELEGHWVSAMANPEEVPAYVKACIESASKDAIRREALETDADRYRWLREQHWNEADVFVIAGSKSQVHLGTDCPRLDRLDAAIDAALSQKVGDQQ